MNRVLELILDGENLSTAQMAEVLNMDEAEVNRELDQLKSEDVLLGWRPIIHQKVYADKQVRAVIEVKISPEREGGFDRTAERVSRFPEVESCYLMSGGYDLLCIVKGSNLREVASFVSERLATISGVLSTATHFLLRAYKEQGYYLGRSGGDVDKPAVSP